MMGSSSRPDTCWSCCEKNRAFAMPPIEPRRIVQTCGFFDRHPFKGRNSGPELQEVVRSDRVRSSLTRSGGGPSLFALWLAGQDVRGMMKDHAPPRPRALEDIGHEDGGDRDVSLELRENVLRARHPGESTVHLYLNVRESEPELPAVLEDGLPGLPHALPAREEAPAGMNTAHVVGVPPQLVHGLEIAALDGAVEAIVGLLDLGMLLVGGQHGTLTTSTPRSSSTTRDSRRAPGQGPSTHTPVACSKMAPWVEQMR